MVKIRSSAAAMIANRTNGTCFSTRRKINAGFNDCPFTFAHDGNKPLPAPDDDFLVDQTWECSLLGCRHQQLESVAILCSSVSTAVENVDPPQKKIYVKLTRAEAAASPLEDTAEIPVIETLGPTIL
jgi:hypothetical protein